MERWISQNRSIFRHPLVAETMRREEALGGDGEKGSAGDGDVFVGWGYKSSGRWAMDRAREHSSSFRLFEDGFIRSLKPGYGKGALYSLVEDRTGIYYDGTGTSDLVTLLDGDSPNDDGWQKQAQDDLDRYRLTGASKYNWYPDEFDPEALDRAMPESGVLVVDQTAGDASIRHGGCDLSDFNKLLAAALEDNPGKPVYLRGHPDHLYRSKKSCLHTSTLLDDPRLKRLPANLAPWQVFERTDLVYVATSLLGLEALLHEKPVVTFGCPFYAGWGLTDDRHPSPPERKKTRSRLELFHAAYHRYTRYFDPDTLKPCGLSRILDHLALQKQRFGENNRTFFAVGMSPWKIILMNRYLRSWRNQYQRNGSFGNALLSIRENPSSRILVWGRKQENPSPRILFWRRKQENPKPGSARLIRVEDGFLRSAGLGAEFHMPLSLVFDETGIYYDSNAPSDLENILQTHDFSPGEIRDAEELIQLILSQSLTKYNLEEPSESSADWPEARGDGVRILVPGQVEADASIQWGSPQWQTNLDLLREVRRRNPDAVIAYKPHPDVVKNLRPGRAISAEIEALCDRVVTGLGIVPWLESCNEVHTLTSLSGFEALLRHKKVVCYGAPFYAGWGLTEDLVSVPRRGRERTLEELVAAALIRYPRYLNPATGEFTTALGAARLIAKRGDPVYSRPWYLRLIASGKTLLRRR